MKHEIINNWPVSTTETKEEAVAIINEFLDENLFGPLTEGEIRDWEIEGGETVIQLDNIVKDYVSEMQTERAAWKNRDNDLSLQDIAQE